MLVKLAAFLLLATLLVQNNVNATLNLGSSGLPAVPTPLGQNDIANKVCSLAARNINNYIKPKMYIQVYEG